LSGAEGDVAERLLVSESADERSEPRNVGLGQAVVGTISAPEREGPNEDAALILPLRGERGVIAVADGAGSYPQGNVASRVALEALAQAVEANPTQLRSAVLDGFEAAEEAVRALGTGAATTLVVVALEGQRARIFHCGDSMALLCGQKGKQKHETVPHSPTGYGQAAGLLSETGAFKHRDRHLVCNLVGMGDLTITLGPVLELAARDTIVLGSDGLWDNAYVAEVIDHARVGPLDESRDALLAAAREHMLNEPEPVGKPDDLTLILYRPL